MAEIIVGEKVVTRIRETGTIVSFDDNFIYVEFKNRVAKLQLDAFEQKFIRYENADLQRKIDEAEEAIKSEIARQEEERRSIKEDKDKMLELAKAKSPIGIVLNSATVRLDPAPLNLKSIKKNDKDLIQAIFNECDKDIVAYYDAFLPKMKYHQHYTRSRYCTGFLTKYLDTYVLRVFSRNDVYQKGHYAGVNVSKSDTTEIMRVLCVNNQIYYFAKHITRAGESVNNTTAHAKWHITELASFISLDEVVKDCDCKYLNDYTNKKSINCHQYTKLLMPAFYNNKVEIVFKHGLFKSTYRIDDIESYLEAFSSKQIDFACKHEVINALPFIKKYDVVDLRILSGLETLLKRAKSGNSIYDVLVNIFERLGFDCPDLDKRLIKFLRKTDVFIARTYYDYICLLYQRGGATIEDFFDKEYLNRHAIMTAEQRVHYSKQEELDYSLVAKELEWIDRKENDYYIIVPKTIPEFANEGIQQHNCVFTNGYFRYVIKRHSIIVFLRKVKNESFVTIEYDYETFEVLQALGKYNGSLSKELYNYVVDLGERLHHERLTQQ